MPSSRNSRKSNLPTIRFSSRTTRNSFDNQADVDTESGRLVLDSSKGVRYRCGLIVKYGLSKGPMSVADMVTLLQVRTKNDSYSANDIPACLAQFRKHNIASSNGRGRDAKWSLVRNGKARWESAPKVSL